MIANFENQTLTLEGSLTERTSLADVETLIDQEAANGSLDVDFSGIDVINSMGLQKWITIIAEKKLAIRYINCPVWQVVQLNIMKDFLKFGASVKSFQAPFHCEDDDTPLVYLLEVGDDVPILADYNDYTFAPLTIKGKTYTPDFEPSEYLYFLSQLS